MNKKPNVILFLTDDLGYGDLSCLNENSKIHTKNLDKLASEGMVFTDAHSSSAVCTPSRYGVLTGRYNWRSRLKQGVLPGCASPLIEEGRMTIGSLLQKEGYQTAAVGKWHLGMGWQPQEGKKIAEYVTEVNPHDYGIDFEKPILNGPTTRGFDYYFGMAASMDQAPYTYIENDRVVEIPTEDVGNIGFVPLQPGKILEKDYGPAAPGFDWQKIVPDMHNKMLETVEKFAKEDKPFFLYAPTPAVHGPLLPADEFIGKSGIGPYGDFVLQVDDFIGQLERKLEDLGIADNTIIIFTSDNGCAPIADPVGLSKEFDHNPSYVFRGCKFDIWEGGHRIPLIIKWPGNIKPGSVSNEHVCLIDMFATIAQITGAEYGDTHAEDSVSNLPIWLGEKESVRETMIHHNFRGNFSIRKGQWKLEMCPGSGGVSAPVFGEEGMPEIQLYDLSTDIGETNNVQDQYPEIVAELKAELIKQILDGRSTPGEKQQNVQVENWPGIEFLNA